MAIITTVVSGDAWSPDLYVFAPEDAVPDALILRATTIGGEVEGDEPATRVAYVDDDDAVVVPEGTVIPDAEPELAERLVYTTKVAQIVTVSNEQWRQSRTPDNLSQSVGRAIVKKSDDLLLNAPDPSPDAAPSVGILNAPGTVSGAYVSGNLDGLIDLVATLQSNDANPNLILMGPLGWAQFRKLKQAADSNANLLGAGTNDAQSLLLSLPVVVNNRIAGYDGAVVDTTAIVSAVGPVRIATSEHAAFKADSVVLRATFRAGHVLVRPDRIGTFDIAQPGS